MTKKVEVVNKQGLKVLKRTNPFTELNENQRRLVLRLIFKLKDRYKSFPLRINNELYMVYIGSRSTVEAAEVPYLFE